MKRLSIFLVAVLLSAALFGCSSHKRYAHIVSTLRQRKAISRNSDSFHLVVADAKTRRCLPGVKVTIASKNAPVEVTADDYGLFTVPLRADLEKENPRLVADCRGSVVFGGLPPYAWFFCPHENDGGPDAKEGGPEPSSVFFQAVTLGDWEPIPNARVAILSRHNPLELVADANGLVEIPFAQSLKEENPPLFVKTLLPYMLISKNGYLDLIAPALESGLIVDGTDSVYIGLVEDPADKPLENARVKILSQGGRIELVSDAAGVVKVPVANSLRAENPPVIIHFDRPLSIRFMVAGAGSYGNLTWRNYSKAALARLSPEGRGSIVADDFSVWYDPECLDEAENVARLLARQRELIKDVTGLEPIKWGVLVLADLPANATYVAKRTKHGPLVWCYSAEEIRNGLFERLNTHEWTEHTLAESLDLYSRDRKNRIIGDGLAEYVSFLAAGLPPGYGDDLQDLLEKNSTHVNLMKTFRCRLFFPVLDVRVIIWSTPKDESAGYILSFAFWHDLCDKYGKDLPSRFLAEFAASRRRDSKTAVAILEKLTGDHALRERLEHGDVAKALDLVKSLEKPADTSTPPVAPAR